MKYQVQIKYTNPAHEHVSLRRRVDTVTRLVEAKSEQEALNRAANQQRALGFMIKEASVVKPEAIKEEVEQIDEDKNALTADHKKTITAHMVKRYGGSKRDVSFRYDPVTRTHSVEHESNETGMGYSHMINFKGRTATVENHPYMTSDYYSEEVEQIDKAKGGVLHTGAVNGEGFEIRHNSDNAFSLDPKKLHSLVAKQNPHLETHQVKAIVASKGKAEFSADHPTLGRNRLSVTNDPKENWSGKGSTQFKPFNSPKKKMIGSSVKEEVEQNVSEAKRTKAVNRVVEAAKNARGKNLGKNPKPAINTTPVMDANIK